MPTLRNRRYSCSHCLKTYGKAEHLIRHERTHTGSRPFQCKTCLREFSRPDSLARHAKRHKDSSYAIGTYHAPSTGMNHEISSENNPQINSNQPATVPTFDEVNLSESATGIQSQNTISFQLNWPDSETLLQSILSDDFLTWPSHDVPTAYLTARSDESETTSQWQSPHGQDKTDSTDAINKLSHVITSVSADISDEAKAIGLTSVFLDGCFDLFWNRFVPVFPVVHRPTFAFKDWTYPLILNAIALGSIFTGQAEDIAKGEVLWKLAHTAVATSWHTLINHKGLYDSCCGVQLVLTAVLGQTYAMLSRNTTLRKTAQIFHSLGFFWARETGMYDTDYDHSYNNSVTTDSWQSWAAKETQLRALLGHYILDGQLSNYTGAPTCQRHSSNSLPLPCSDNLFGATTLEQWVEYLGERPWQNKPFYYFFDTLFSPAIHVKHLSQSLSAFSALIALEGIKSMVSENQTCPIETVGAPSRSNILFALSRLYAMIFSSQMIEKPQKDQLLLRWHTVCLDAVIDSTFLIRNVCNKFDIVQKVYGGRKPDQGFNLERWMYSVKARRSLLHAITIHNMIRDLPLNGTQNSHLPAALMAAAVVYCSALLSGTTIISLPESMDWESAILFNQNSGGVGNDYNSDLTNYLNGSLLQMGVNRNLRYDMGCFSIWLKNLGHIWGVSHEMHEILERMLSACNISIL